MESFNKYKGDKRMKLSIIIVGVLYVTALIGYRKAYLKRLEEVNNE